MKILDCTLRDGGYYNSWDFDLCLVDKYIDAISSSGIEYIELGFRSVPKSGFLGAFAYTSDSIISQLKFSDTLKLCVMIDAKMVLKQEEEPNIVINKIFNNKIDSHIDVVRVACHPTEIYAVKPIVEELHALGYRVFINIMQSKSLSNDELFSISTFIESLAVVEVLYFADSFGNMNKSDVIRIINAIKAGWFKEIGFHAHDNMGLANENCKIAYENGVQWIDATVTGMGRGAGNAATEILLSSLPEEYKKKYNEESLFNIVLDDFEPLKTKYGWGSSLLYYKAAKHNIHPTYVQKLLSDVRVTNNDIVNAISYLSSVDSSSYSKVILESSLRRQDDSPGDANLTVAKMDVDVLSEITIVGGGGTVSTYKNAILVFLEKYNGKKISININDIIGQEYFDYYIFSHNVKYTSDKYKYLNIDKKVVIPCNRFSSSDLSFFKGDIINYNLSINDSKFEFDHHGCVLPEDYTAFYGIAYALSRGVKRINLIGFDGYSTSDYRNQLISRWLAYVIDIYGIEVVSLTPTIYPIVQESLYAYL